jgi:GR25 family glycosyltransferase involved in LPS biosynthesis
MMDDNIAAALRAVHRAYASLGTFERHLKRAEGKGNHSSIRNVDFTYMINLDTRPEKYAVSRRYLEAYGITPYRFSAVNGWELSKTAVQDVGLKYRAGMTPLLGTTYPNEVDDMIQSHELTAEVGKTYFVHCMPLGAIGCSLSHISVLQDAYDSGYQTIWVMEDDVEVLQNPHMLSDLISELDAVVGADHWDVLFTDVDYRTGAGQYLPAYGAAKRPDMDCRPEERFSEKYTKTAQVSKQLRRIGARFGTTSMVIRRSGITKLLAFFKTRHIYLPHDLDNHLPDGIQRYGLTFDLVTNMLHSVSDIGTAATYREGRTVESFLQKYTEPIYQDLVIGGEIHRIGTDVCESRYQLIAPVLDRQRGPFSVLDVGAAQGYFSLRIAQDYPQSWCVMVESDDTSYYAHHGSMLHDLCAMNPHLPNIMYLDRRLDLSDLSYLSGAEHFDVVLALLVVHLMDDRLREQARILEALLNLGDHVILEVANDVNHLHTAYVEYLSDTFGAQCLGEVKRHKDPHSTATGKLLWFTRQPSRSAGDGTGRRLPPIQEETFQRFHGAYPADFPHRSN